LVKPRNNETLSFLKRFRLGESWDSKPRPVRTSPNHLMMGLRRRNRVLVKPLVQSSLVSDLPTRNSVADLFPSMMQQKCGVQVTLSRRKVEFVYANPVTVLGRKKTRTTTCTDSLSLSVSTQAKPSIPTALSNKVCVTTEQRYEASSRPKAHALL
jgi:hypothetical protein